MRLYKVVYTTQQGKQITRFLWESSEVKAKREASRVKRELAKANARDHLTSIGVVSVDVPTNKAGLVTWLNTHLTNVLV